MKQLMDENELNGKWDTYEEMPDPFKYSRSVAGRRNHDHMVDAMAYSMYVMKRNRKDRICKWLFWIFIIIISAAFILGNILI